MKTLFSIIFLIFWAISPVLAQKPKPKPPVVNPPVKDNKGKGLVVSPTPKPNPKPVTNPTLEQYREQCKDLVNLFAQALNMLGDPEGTRFEKETVITASYLKIFKDNLVQIEDDLDEKRLVVTNKNIPAYLKDVEFFFKEVYFEFNIEDVSILQNSENKPYFLVKLTRNISGTTIKGEKINANKVRYIEINLNEAKQEVKIASVYTTKLNEKEENRYWWRTLPADWKAVFAKEFTIKDSITEEQLKMVLNIEELSLRDNKQILDLEPLSKLTNLKKLDCSNTNISSLNPIRNMTKLVSLKCSKTSIATFEMMKYATSLQEVIFNNTEVSDLEPLRSFADLEKLQAVHTKISNLEPLSELKKLKELRVSDNEILDLKPLSALSALEYLQISSTKTYNLEALATLTKLKHLEIDKTPVIDVTPLQNLQNLEVLTASNSKLASLSPLLKLPNLKKVYCDNSQVSKKDALQFMASKPSCLVIYDSEAMIEWWAKLSPEWKAIFTEQIKADAKPSKEQLALVANITNINIAGKTAINSLEPLRNVLNLKELNCSGTNVESLLPISDLMDLRVLDCSKTKVKDLKPLELLTNLETLNAESNDIENISALEKTSNLKIAYLDGNKIRVDQPAYFLSRYPNRLLIYRTSELETWWKGLPEAWKTVFGSYVKVDAKPTNEQLHRIVSLEAINISNNKNITDLGVLTIFSRLKELRLSDTQIADLSSISTITSLEILQFSRCPVSSTEPIKNMLNLKQLDMESSGVNKLDDLTNLPNLQILKCSGTQIKSLKPISNLAQLTELECFNTKISTLKEIYGRSSLKVLKCYNTNITKATLDEFKKKNPDCEVLHYGTFKQWFELWK